MEPNLENIYASSVANKRSINNLSYGSSMVQKERDPSLVNLENSVFSQLFELIKEEKPPKPVYKQNELKVVSYEEALKELEELEKALNSVEHLPIS
jgi:glycyl-tRNA synthetase alpha subunit